MRAVEAKECRRVLIGGGVAASRALRNGLAQALGPDGELFYPSPRLATDNGAMIARAALFHWRRGECAGLDVTARADLDRKSTRLHSSNVKNSYTVFCLK